jgi:hypothetical protein
LQFLFLDFVQADDLIQFTIEAREEFLVGRASSLTQ